MREWSEIPSEGNELPGPEVWSHELDFWGGDLKSVESKLDYVHALGADVLYLNPIFKAFTNHKYDTVDYYTVDPQFGTNQELRRLLHAAHSERMKVMLDGVFNHVGRRSPIFQSALVNPKSPKRGWFFFGPQYPGGYRGWAGAKNLPAWRLENPAVRDYLWRGKDSVVQHYLKLGIDGWRLDVAFEIGPQYLAELTKNAHLARAGSAVVGEISGYPSNWFSAVDGVFNFTSMEVSRQMLEGKIDGGSAGRMLQHVVDDAGIENLLKSWLLIDNHDTPRFASVVPSLAERQTLRLLQLTLPGCPMIYYGSELGMTGDQDPANRAPMRWDLVSQGNPELTWTKSLISLRKRLPALRFGDFTALDSTRLLAFSRTTDQLRQSVIVVVNPTGKPVHEVFPSRIGRIENWGGLVDQIGGSRVVSKGGLLDLDLKAGQAMILTPAIDRFGGYSPYDRLR
jgi:glycosidase